MFNQIDPNTQAEFSKWVANKTPERALQSNAAFLLRRTKGISSVVFTDKMESYTDGNNVTVSIIPFFLQPEFGPVYWMESMRINMAHEFQHANSSRFDLVPELIKEYTEYMAQSFGAESHTGTLEYLAQSALNCTEDGRINEIVVQNHPGYFAGMRMTNYAIREMNEITEIAANPADELRDFFTQLLVYSKSGLDAIGITVYKGQRLEREFEQIRSLIDQAVNAESALECKERTLDALKISGSYVADLMQQSIQESGSESEITKTAEKLPKQRYSKDAMQNEEQKSDGDHSNSPRYQRPEKEEKQNEQQDGSAGDSGSGNQSQTDAGNDASQGSPDEGETNSKNKPQSGAGNQEKNGSSPKAQSGPASKAESGNNNSGEGKESKNGTPSQKEKENEKDTHVSSLTDVIGSTGLSDYSPNTLSEKEIRESIAASERLLTPRFDGSEKNAACQPTPLSKADEQTLNRVYGKLEKQETYLSPRGTHLTPVLNKEAQRLHCKLENILTKNRAMMSGTRKGVLNTSGLWKTGIESQDIFRRKNPPKAGNCAVYELIDKSGSMREKAYRVGDTYINKLSAALSTAAIMEEALKGLSSTKISLFSAGDVCQNSLTIVKDFDQTASGNRCMDALTAVSPKGGNMDGAAIRIAAMDLAKRPEKTKILIVLSDGMPSAYDSTDEAINDVRTAVSWARSQGIIVVSVMYGDDSFLKTNYSLYKQMYERGVIACRPGNIITEFERILTALIR